MQRSLTVALRHLTHRSASTMVDALRSPTTQRKRHVAAGLAFHWDPNEIKLPQKGQENVLITSALPYVNNVPHLGNIIGCVLSADVFARYARLCGRNTIYICGTDEYGTATETKALEDGVSCQALCDKYSALHAEIYKDFDISFDKFGRTTTPQQTTIAQDIFKKLHANGFLEEQTMTQMFCDACQRFLADRYIEGTCPHCKYPDARGDQCDGCGKLLNPNDLVQPRCKVCNSAPHEKDSQHMFLKLPELEAECKAWVERQIEEGKWTANGAAITMNWINDGLKPRCITRDLKWGTPVPLEAMKDKVFYVWFDAPIGYLSITANYTADWEKWWKNPDEVKLYQFMGKDNVPFHSVIFPCSKMGTKEKWTLVHHISTTEYLMYENDKFSKSRNVGVFGTHVRESGIPISVWRYTLLANRPETADSNFSWSDMVHRCNSELLANVGNLINRALKFCKAKYDGVVPELVMTAKEEALYAEIDQLLAQYKANMEVTKFRAALFNAMTIASKGNLYLTEMKLDNALFANEPERCGTAIATILNLAYFLSALFYPFMPATSESICAQLNVPLRTMPQKMSTTLFAGHEINEPAYLFSRIDDKRGKELYLKYGGAAIEAAKEAAKLKKKEDAKRKKEARKASKEDPPPA